MSLEEIKTTQQTLSKKTNHYSKNRLYIHLKRFYEQPSIQLSKKQKAKPSLYSQLTKKFQNTRSSLTETVEKIIKAGLRPMAGFIIGFDGEKKGAADRIINFVEEAAIPTALFGMLQALPNTALWTRLEKEGRLRLTGKQDINQSTLMNFVPTRPIEDIATEYIEAFWKLYDPEVFLDRTYRCFLKLRALNNRFENSPIRTINQLYF